MVRFKTYYTGDMQTEGVLSKALGTAGLAGALALGGMHYNHNQHKQSTPVKQTAAVKHTVAAPVKHTPVSTIAAKPVDNTSTNSIADTIKKYENSKADPEGGWDKSRGRWYAHESKEKGSDTIAYGHKILPGENFSKGLSDTDALLLLKRDIVKKEAFAGTKITNYTALPIYVKTGIINALYRGDLGPKTIALMNAGQWSKVPAEYLNHTNYTSGKWQGVKKRMEANAEAFKRYAKELKSISHR